MRNLITDVAGITVGCADDPRLASGVTVALFDEPAVASVSVSGGAPAGRDLECLAPDARIDKVDAILFSGGSGFGLDAASGAQAFLRERGRGYAIGGALVPLVPQAICFDLLNGGNKDWGRYPPYREIAYAACELAGVRASAPPRSTSRAGRARLAPEPRPAMWSGRSPSSTRSARR